MFLTLWSCQISLSILSVFFFDQLCSFFKTWPLTSKVKCYQYSFLFYLTLVTMTSLLKFFLSCSAPYERFSFLFHYPTLKLTWIPLNGGDKFMREFVSMPRQCFLIHIHPTPLLAVLSFLDLKQHQARFKHILWFICYCVINDKVRNKVITW